MIVTWQMIVELFVLAIPIACVSRTVVFEEVFREPREFCIRRSHAGRRLFERKFFYLFTCEYCFSHYVTLFFMFLTSYHLLFPADWRGYLIAFFSLVFVSNAYLNLYNRLRIDITAQKVETKGKEKEIEQIDREVGNGHAETDLVSTVPGLPRNQMAVASTSAGQGNRDAFQHNEQAKNHEKA